MIGKLRCMTSLYLEKEDKLLMLYRIGSRVVEESYIGTGEVILKRRNCTEKRCDIYRIRGVLADKRKSMEEVISK